MFVSKVGTRCPTLCRLLASRILYAVLVGEKQSETARARSCTQSWSHVGQLLVNSSPTPHPMGSCRGLPCSSPLATPDVESLGADFGADFGCGFLGADFVGRTFMKIHHILFLPSWPTRIQNNSLNAIVFVILSWSFPTQCSVLFAINTSLIASTNHVSTKYFDRILAAMVKFCPSRHWNSPNCQKLDKIDLQDHNPFGDCYWQFVLLHQPLKTTEHWSPRHSQIAKDGATLCTTPYISHSKRTNRCSCYPRRGVRENVLEAPWMPALARLESSVDSLSQNLLWVKNCPKPSYEEALPQARNCHESYQTSNKKESTRGVTGFGEPSQEVRVRAAWKRGGASIEMIGLVSETCRDLSDIIWAVPFPTTPRAWMSWSDFRKPPDPAKTKEQQKKAGLWAMLELSKKTAKMTCLNQKDRRRCDFRKWFSCFFAFFAGLGRFWDFCGNLSKKVHGHVLESEGHGWPRENGSNYPFGIFPRFI